MRDFLYLNNSGSRWIIPGRMQFYSLENTKKTGYEWKFILRTADFYESCGNFATVNFRVAGKRKSAFFDDLYRYKGLPIVVPSNEFLCGFFGCDNIEVYEKKDELLKKCGVEY